MRRLAELSPANFAIVMATGIVSVAAQLHGLERVALALFWLNVAAWLALVALNALRLAAHRARFLGDLADHSRAPGFFTAVAGTSVLASQCIVFEADPRLAAALALVAAALWAALVYGIFTALTVKEEKPALDRGLNGGWLLAVVATQSLAVVASLLVPRAAPGWEAPLDFLALSAWLFGGMLYMWIIALIFYRYTFFRLSPGDLTPPYWINMGAMAISTLAGATLVLAGSQTPLIGGLLPFVMGATLLFWATATWWIPMLLILGVWRHVVKRYPLRYDPLYWGAVFPLGMYSVATARMAAAMDLRFLWWIPPVFCYAAIGAWLLALVGLGRRLATGLGAQPVGPVTGPTES